MTKSSSFSVRGRRALALISDERELGVVRRQLDRFGMTIAEFGAGGSKPTHELVDVVIVDADILPLSFDLSGAWGPDTPIIALVGTETPSRLKCLLELDPASFLVKPLRSAGLYAALVLAFDRAKKNCDVARRIERLEERVRARRIVLSALLQVMRRHDLSEPEAFALIRRTAMESRATIEHVSAEIINVGALPGSATRSA